MDFRRREADADVEDRLRRRGCPEWRRREGRARDRGDFERDR